MTRHRPGDDLSPAENHNRTVDPARFEPDIQALAELENRPVAEVRRAWDGDRRSKSTRTRAKEERRSNADGNPEGTPLPTEGELAAKIATNDRLALLDPEVRKRFEEVRARYVPLGAKLAGEPRDFAIGNNRVLRWTPDLVSLVFVTHDRESGEERESPAEVIAGRFRPVRRQVIEGETYYTVELAPGAHRTGTFAEIYDRLDKIEGRILSRAFGHDVVAQLLYRMCDGSEVGYPTYGFYGTPTGQLVEAREPTPVKDEQQKVAEQVSAAVRYEAKPGDLAAYSAYASYYELREMLPLLGLSAISPFALVLRERKVLVPHVLAYSQERNLGKSHSLFAVADKMHGREHVTAGSLKSEYRFPSHVDACCGPLAVEEAERFPWDILGGELKASAESALVSKRGTTSLTQVSYRSRSVLFFSANASGIVSGPALARFLLLHFAEEKALERRVRNPRFEQAYAALQPIGPEVAREIARKFPRVVDLVAALDRFADAMDRECAAQGVELRDPRRSRSWGLVLMGLHAFCTLARRLGDKFAIPDLATFVRAVVGPVESSTFEGEVTPIAAFRSWFENYKVAAITRTFEVGSYQDRRTGEDVGTIRPTEIDSLKGEGRTFQEGILERPGGDRVPGWWVTRALLELYNRQQSRADHRFTDLKDLALTAARETILSEADVLDEEGKNVPRHEFRQAGRQRGAFVPSEQWSVEHPMARVRMSGRGKNHQANLEESTGHDRVPSCPVVSGVPDVPGFPGHGPDMPETTVTGVSTDDKSALPDTRTRISAYAREGAAGREAQP